MISPLKYMEPQIALVDLWQDSASDLVPFAFFSYCFCPEISKGALEGKIDILATSLRCCDVYIWFHEEKSRIVFTAESEGLMADPGKILCQAYLHEDGQLSWNPDYPLNIDSSVRLAEAVIRAAIKGGDPTPDYLQWHRGPQINALLDLRDAIHDDEEGGNEIAIDVYGETEDHAIFCGILRVSLDQTLWDPQIGRCPARNLNKFPPSPQIKFLQEVSQKAQKLISPIAANHPKASKFPW